MAALADPDRRTIKATDELTDVAPIFKRYNFVSAPVIDAAERLVGVMTIDDVVDIIEEEADEDLKALGGVKSDEELTELKYSRLSTPLICASMGAATVFAMTSAVAPG